METEGNLQWLSKPFEPPSRQWVFTFMALLFIPDEILTKLKSGELSFSDLDEFGMGMPEIDVEPRVLYRKIPIPQELRWEILERDNFACVQCGSRRFLQADHIKPESKGGESIKDNLQTLCKRCNIKKGSKL